MKILAIIGSPRKRGNTFKLVKDFGAALAERIDVSFDYVTLIDANIEMCRGCFQCLARGVEHCPLKDDVADIAERMSAADGIIIASPVYSVAVPGLLKNWIDRMAYTFHRPRYSQQDLMLIVSSGGAGISDTTKYLRNLKGWGMRSVTTLGVTTPPFDCLPKAEEERARAIAKAADQFAVRLADRRPVRPKFGDMMQFVVMRAMSRFAPNALSADAAYYSDNGLDTAQYYTATRGGKLYYWLAMGIARIVDGAMRKRYTDSRQARDRDTLRPDTPLS